MIPDFYFHLTDGRCVTYVAPLLWFGGPLTMQFVDRDGHHVIVHWGDLVDDDGRQRWLVVEVSTAAVERFRDRRPNGSYYDLIVRGRVAGYQLLTTAPDYSTEEVRDVTDEEAAPYLPMDVE